MFSRLLSCVVLCAAVAAARGDPLRWNMGDPSPEAQAALWWLNHARADPVGTLQSLVNAAPGDPVLAACFTGALPETATQFLNGLQAAVSVAQTNAVAFPRSAAISQAPFVLWPPLNDDAQARAVSAASGWTTVSYRPGPNPAASFPAVPLRFSQAFDTQGLPESILLSDLYFSGVGPREGMLAWLCQPGTGSPPPSFLVQGDSLSNLTIGHARVAGIGESAVGADGGRTLCLVRRNVEGLPDGALPFGNTATVFITGVVYRDQNRNGVYDPGEGIAGVTVTLDRGAWSAVTATAGGFAIPVSAGSGACQVQAQLPDGTVQSADVNVGEDNVACDWALPALPTSPATQTTVDGPDGSPALINVSARGQAEPDAGALTVGFTISAPPGATKSVLVRAVGPSLQTVGIPAAECIPATHLQVFEGSRLIADNAGWTSTPDGGAAVRAAAATSGAFALTHWTGGGGDSALVLPLPAGQYTAIVTPPAGAPAFYTTGHLGLAEVYDLSPQAGSTLVNLSARGMMGAGDTALIIGATVGGTGHQRLLVRAAGPALAAFGVQPTQADPVLTVFDSDGSPLVSNDNWSQSAQADQIATLSAAAGAFPFALNSPDAAVLLRTPPGALTAQATAALGSASAGIVLMELYSAP